MDGRTSVFYLTTLRTDRETNKFTITTVNSDNYDIHKFKTDTQKDKTF